MRTTETHEFLGHTVEVRRKAFRRHLGVSIYPNGRVVVAVNKTCSWNEIKAFLQKRRDWLEKGLEEVSAIQKKYPRREFCSGEIYPYLGRDYELSIERAAQISLHFERDKIVFNIPKKESELSEKEREKFFKKLKSCYRETAKEIIGRRIRLYSEKMGLYPNKVQYRGQRSIWGSCSPENNLSLNWKLVVAPLPVIDYVVVHELSHIKHKNHSAHFWSLVHKTLPHVETSQKWLKTNHYSADFLMTRSELWSEF